MKSIIEVKDLRGKYVLLRSSLNEPVQEGEVLSKFRLLRSLPTLRYLHEQGAKVLLTAHIGRKPEETLKPIFEEMNKHLPVQWGGLITGSEWSERRGLMGEGDILMAENIRQDPREKANAPDFVAHLAAQADLYVNDAFAAAHRKQASTYGIASELPAYAGLTLIEEVQELKKVMEPKSPSLFFLGGAKFDTKMPLVEKYIGLYDKVFIGGALANDLFKARGLEVGESLVADEPLKDVPFLHSEKLLLPIDVIVDGGEDGRTVKSPEQVKPDEKILDAGPMTIDLLATYIEKAKTILWNGPFGAYEMGYTQATEITARHVAVSEAHTVIGGGDTVAAVDKLQINDLFSFVSTGGGATLDFLENGTTPVIERLSERE